MAIVNFSVPEDLKDRFNKIFAHQNKSHIIAELMEQAIERHEKQKQRAHAVEGLLKLRKKQKSVTTRLINAARKKGRP